jgi:hypothetical protein
MTTPPAAPASMSDLHSIGSRVDPTVPGDHRSEMVDLDAWFVQLQAEPADTQGQTWLNDAMDSSEDEWLFSSNPLFPGYRRFPARVAKALRFQRYLDRWTETVTGLSNAVASITQSLRTLTQSQ